MKRLLLALALLGSATSAFASGGTATTPFYVREQQGTTLTYFEVSCTVAGDVALVTAAQAANARSILFQNEATADTVESANFATICPVAASAGACNAITKGLTIHAKGSLPIDRAVRDSAWSCKGDTATVIIGVLIEK